MEGVEGRGGEGRREGWRGVEGRGGGCGGLHTTLGNRLTGYISGGKWMTEERLAINKGKSIVSLSLEEYHHSGNHRQ